MDVRVLAATIGPEARPRPRSRRDLPLQQCRGGGIRAGRHRRVHRRRAGRRRSIQSVGAGGIVCLTGVGSGGGPPAATPASRPRSCSRTTSSSAASMRSSGTGTGPAKPWPARTALADGPDDATRTAGGFREGAGARGGRSRSSFSSPRREGVESDLGEHNSIPDEGPGRTTFSLAGAFSCRLVGARCWSSSACRFFWSCSELVQSDRAGSAQRRKISTSDNRGPLRRDEHADQAQTRRKGRSSAASTRISPSEPR